MAYRVLEEVEVFSQKPEPRSGHRSCATLNHLLIYGGYDKRCNNKVYSEIFCFNTISKKWCELPHSRGVRMESASSSMVLFEDNLIVFGGSGFPFGHTNTDDLSIYSLKTKNWLKLQTQGPNENVPPPKYGQSMVIATVDNCPRLYVFSGTIGRQFLDDMHYYDLLENHWYDIWGEDAPEGRYRHEVVAYGDHFYMFGGAIQMEAFGFDKIWRFSFLTHKWTKVECKSAPDGSFPLPRKSHSCVIWKDNVYMCGGLGYSENGSLQIYNDIWSICLLDMAWKKLEITLPVPLYFHSAAVTLDGCMYIFGGVDNSDQRSSSTYEIMLDVPSLLKITLRFLIKRLDHRCDQYTTLENLGVPGHVLENALSDFPAG